MSDTLNELSLQELIGRECVYYEKAFFHVTVVGVKVDGEQLKLLLSQIPSVGFSARELGRFEVSCVSEYLRISANSIHASMINWALVINENATQQLVRLAAAAVDPFDLFEEYKRLRRNDFEQTQEET
jgi:hypothetical protein